MLNFIKRFLNKEETDSQLLFSKSQNASFELKVDGIVIGTLNRNISEWEFKYTEDFKDHSDEYNKITGFSDLNKTYRSESLWPFFQTRIPGLKQPAIQEILRKENITENNEVELLKRFGKKTISNPYKLELK